MIEKNTRPHISHFDDKHLDLEYRLRTEHITCQTNGRNNKTKKNYERGR